MDTTNTVVESGKKEWCEAPFYRMIGQKRVDIDERIQYNRSNSAKCQVKTGRIERETVEVKVGYPEGFERGTWRRCCELCASDVRQPALRV